MNVAVIGSCRSGVSTPWPLRNECKFGDFCEKLGEKLAKEKHFLIIPCDNDKKSADWSCLQGFKRKSADPKSWTVKALGGTNPSSKGHIEAAREANCVILMGGANGTYAAGMTAIYRRIPLLPLACFGGAAEDVLEALKLSTEHPLRSAVFKGTPFNEAHILKVIMDELSGHPRLLLVHGRSKDRDSVLNILTTHFPKLHPPIILDYSGNAAIGLANKFSSLAGSSTGAIVICTPDDIGNSVLDANGIKLDPAELIKFVPRARENVWLEMGWLWAAIGRDRILMLVKNDTNIPSDIKDAVYVPYRDNPKDVENQIIQFVKKMRGESSSSSSDKSSRSQPSNKT